MNSLPHDKFCYRLSAPACGGCDGNLRRSRFKVYYDDAFGVL